eukprot:3847439-Rhodomonas_salina.1
MVYLNMERRKPTRSTRLAPPVAISLPANRTAPSTIRYPSTAHRRARYRDTLCQIRYVRTRHGMGRAHTLCEYRSSHRGGVGGSGTRSASTGCAWLLRRGDSRTPHAADSCERERERERARAREGGRERGRGRERQRDSDVT